MNVFNYVLVVVVVVLNSASARVEEQPESWVRRYFRTLCRVVRWLARCGSKGVVAMMVFTLFTLSVIVLGRLAFPEGTATRFLVESVATEVERASLDLLGRGR